MRQTGWSKALSFLVSVHLVLSLMPVPGLASEVAKYGDVTTVPEGQPAVVADEDASDVQAEPPDGTEPPAFERSRDVDDDVTVKVKAKAGVFPDDANLVVEGLSEERREDTERAVAAQRDEGKDIVASYAYDVRVTDADGSELQPHEGQAVKVSFHVPEATDEELLAQVYQLRDEVDEEETTCIVATVLESEADRETGAVTVQASDLTFFVVEFTKREQQEVLEGGDSSPPVDEQPSAQAGDDSPVVAGTSEPTTPPATDPDDRGGEPTPTMGADATSPAPAEPSSDAANGASTHTEVTAESATSNIVGEVFANAANAVLQGEGDAEAAARAAAEREAMLEEYPTESHEESYYGDSLRLRKLYSTDDLDLGFLVYRDSFYLVPQNQSASYAVSYSTDKLTAHITPAIDPALLEGKTGIVLLREDVSTDVVLVFAEDQAPHLDGDALVVPLEPTDNIALTQLFSDGSIGYSASTGSMGADDLTRALASDAVVVQSGADAQGDTSLQDVLGVESTLGVQSTMGTQASYTPTFHLNPSGTNWKATIDYSSISFDNIDASFDVDIWDLKFDLVVSLAIGFDFDVTSTGASGGRQRQEIIGLGVSLKLFSLNYATIFEAEFDSTPVHIKGRMRPSMDMHWNPLFGVSMRNFQTPITLSTFELANPTRDCNKTVNCYLGTGFTINQGFLSLDVDLWLFEVHIGPVASLNQLSQGGTYFTARLDKDLYNPSSFSRTRDSVHVCAANGTQGCYVINTREVSDWNWNAKLDLYFKSWTWTLKDEHKDLSTHEYHNSLTHGTGLQMGPCPYMLYRVPVQVTLNSSPASGMDVFVHQSLEGLSSSERQLTTDVTNSGGQANLYLPYRDGYYNYVATGSVDGAAVTGSTTDWIRRGNNETVYIQMSSSAKVTLKADITWHADVDDLDVPAIEWVLIQRKLAGTNDWQKYRRIDLYKQGNWKQDIGNLDKYGFVNGKAVPYEYRVRVLSGDEEYAGVVPDQTRSPYVIHGLGTYANAAGQTEPLHNGQYLVTYADEVSDDVFQTHITEVAVVDVELHKQWRLSNAANQPSFVHLALTQRPEVDWEDLAGEQGVADAWVVVRNPTEGATNTLSDLMAAGMLSTSDDISHIQNTPLAIAKADASSGWSVKFKAPKYVNGVKMRYQATELDTSVITNLFAHVYDLNAQVSVPPSGYTAIPGAAFKSGDDFNLMANVVNTDSSQQTIAGTVRWEAFSADEFNPPAWVKIHIKKDGVEIAESPVTLSKEDYPRTTEWVWTLSGDNLDPDASYTVSEEFPSAQDKAKWFCETHGLDVYNNAFYYNSVQLRVRAIFEDGVNPGTNELPVTFKATDGSLTKAVTLSPSSWAHQEHLGNKTEVLSIDGYAIEAPEIAGCVRVYREPILSFEVGNATYTYTVYYALQQAMTIDVSSVWSNVDDTTVYPDSLSADVYRDGQRIATATLTKGANGQWSTTSITQDNEGNALKRVSDAGHHYMYTARQTSVAAGFTSEVLQTDEGENKVSFKLKNTWVGADHVNVKGKVTWVGDEGRTELRPQQVHLSVINSKEERVRSLDVPVSGDGTYEAKFLPGKDAQGNALTYSVLQSHIKYYTPTYATTSYDQDTHTWTCDITNTLTGYCPITIRKTIRGDCKQTEQYSFNIAKYGDAPAPRAATVTINGAGTTQAEFLIDEDGLYLYSVTEQKGTNTECVYDDSRKVVLIARVPGDDGKPIFNSWVGEADEEAPTFETNQSNQTQMTPTQLAMLSAIQNNQSSTVEFINKYAGISVSKTWDIDLEQKDRPSSIQAVVQKKNGDTWENVHLVELNEDNDWQTWASAAEDDPNATAEYRVRELKEQTVLQELLGKARDLVKQGDGKYQEFLDSLKASSYWQYLPEDFKNSTDQSLDALKESLGATSLEDLYDKLLDKIGLAGAEDRIVYDKDDSDKPSGEDAKTNEVTYHVSAHESAVSGGTEDAHVTKYRVGYQTTKQSKHTSVEITNKAVLEIDVIKRWIHPGVDEKDMPEAAWLVLMCKPKEKALDNAKDLASAAGIDLGGVLDYEFPVINPIEGGQDPLTILGELTIGVDLSFIGKLAKGLFGVQIPELAIKRVTKDDNWRFTVVDSKYHLGIPMEYKGAELGSEIIRQIIKYLTDGVVDSPVSFNPFDGYISIPTKAIRTVMGIEDLDLSGLTDKALAKAKSLTADDLKDFGPSTMLDDWHLMANAINIKVDWDSEDDPPVDKDKLQGQKTWDDANDEFGTRPQKIKVYLLANGQRVKDDAGNDVYAETSKAGGWRYTFAGRPRTDDAGKPITYTMEEEAVPGYTTTYDGYNITNKLQTVDLTFTKHWDDDNDRDGMRPDSVEVRLLADGTEVARHTVTAADGWMWKIGARPKCDRNGKDIAYKLEEVSSLDGYTAHWGEGQSTDLVILNTHTPSRLDVSVTKVWDDDNNRDGIRPASISLHLLGNGKGVKDVTMSSGMTSMNIGTVFEYEAGKKVSYTLTEDAVEGYTTTVAGNAEDGFVVTNKHVPQKVAISGQKVWKDDDDRDRKRPESVTVHLLANGAEVESKAVSSSDDWKFSFADKPQNEEGRAITYTVTEGSVADYTTTVTGSAANGFTITNTHEIETVRLRLKKHWADNDNQDGLRPPRVTLLLKANGQTVQTMPVASEHDWESYYVVPKNQDGQAITYALDEDVPDGYTKGEHHDTDPTLLQIDNTHVPQTVTVAVNKVWDDSGNQDGKRPGSVTVRLLADGSPVASQVLTLSESNGWSGEFTDVPAYSKGKKITYAVGEDAVEAYTTSVERNSDTSFTIMNSYEPEQTQVFVYKVWDDWSDRERVRPTSVTVHLLADGNPTDKSLTLSEDNYWMGMFDDLAKNEQGKPIVYTVTEDEVAQYTTQVQSIKDFLQITDDDDALERAFVITNTHATTDVHIKGTKAWNDDNDRDGLRPDNVKVWLLSDGMPVSWQMVTAGEDGTWTYDFGEWPKILDGKEVTYAVREDVPDGDGESFLANPVEGYTTTYEQPVVSTDPQTSQITYTLNITNAHEPEKTKVTVYKFWDDWDDNDGKRPASVTVRLRANGYATLPERTLTLNAGNFWQGTFEGLYKYQNQGQLVEYTLEEDLIESSRGYQPAEYYRLVDDAGTYALVVNEREPEQVSIKGTKLWDDADNQDAQRRDSVRLWLLSDGMRIAWKDVTAGTGGVGTDGRWAFDFGEFPRYRAGKQVAYTVEEDEAIAGYTTTYADPVYDDQNHTWTCDVTNTHAIDKTYLDVDLMWVDWDNQDGKRPDTLTVRLYKKGLDGTDVATDRTVTLSQENDWSDVFADIPRNHEATGDGEAHRIEYFVKAEYEPMSNYGQYYVDWVFGDTDWGYDILAYHEPLKLTVQGHKLWDDDNDRDGMRPESVEVVLYADDAEVDSRTVSADDLDQTGGWLWSFDEVPYYAPHGRRIAYDVRERFAVEGYTTTVTPHDADAQAADPEMGYDITNVHVPQRLSVGVTKVWDDGDDADGLRPDSLTVRLLADGQDTGRTLELSAASDWKGAFEGLYAYEAGRKVAYTVAEDAVPGYTTEVSGDAATGFTITNRHAFEATSVVGSKVWDDNDNKDGVRPASITVRLLADGREVASRAATGEQGWKWAFDGLPACAHGKAIAYAVTEDAVEGYESTVAGSATTGFTVTNKRTAKPAEYTITYDLNGGTFNGSTKKIRETYPVGTVISIHKAPTRKGYTFQYWKGSSYTPGDTYTVKGNHTFVAQWKATTTGSNTPRTSLTSSGTTDGRTTLASTADPLCPPEALLVLAVAGLLCVAAARRRPGRTNHR